MLYWSWSFLSDVCPAQNSVLSFALLLCIFALLLADKQTNTDAFSSATTKTAAAAAKLNCALLSLQALANKKTAANNALSQTLPLFCTAFYLSPLTFQMKSGPIFFSSSFSFRNIFSQCFCCCCCLFLWPSLLFLGPKEESELLSTSSFLHFFLISASL